MDVPLEYMQKIGGENVRWAQGYLDENREFGADMDMELLQRYVEEAVHLAETSDKVVFFMGQPSGVEMEGHDRKDLKLPMQQEILLEKILEVNPNVIVVLSNASAVSMPWESLVAGIFECFMAGQGMGKAIADLLYGKINPSGKLPVSFTKTLEDTSAYLDFPGDKKTVHYGEGVFCGYRYYDLKHTDLLFPFGFGLSYTQFVYSNLKVENSVFDPMEGKKYPIVTLKVKNTGDCAGAEVIQLYVGMFDTVVKRPCKELKNFCKVFLQPGEEKEIHFTMCMRDFAYYDVNHKDWWVPDGTYQILIGSSSQDIRLEENVKAVSSIKYKKVLTGWSKIGELRETPLGEVYFQKIKVILIQYLPETSIFMDRSVLDDDGHMNQIPLRFINLITNGRIDNDMLLAWLDEVNKERMRL